MIVEFLRSKFTLANRLAADKSPIPFALCIRFWDDFLREKLFGCRSEGIQQCQISIFALVDGFHQLFFSYGIMLGKRA